MKQECGCGILYQIRRICGLDFRFSRHFERVHCRERQCVGEAGERGFGLKQECGCGILYQIRRICGLDFRFSRHFERVHCRERQCVGEAGENPAQCPLLYGSSAVP